jgi:peptide-methionine (S)-S-oxide reductase
MQTRRTLIWLAAAIALVVIARTFGTAAFQAERPRAIPAPAVDDRSPATNVAVVAGGCFWGVQGVYQHSIGVTRAVSGYAGGDRATAQYERVGTGRTGHAEAVEITFDPKVISYGQLLQIFFSVAHDPTELNRQGPDVGPQYRSTIFPANEDQARIAAAYIAQLNQARVFGAPIATTIEPGRMFYPAEPYHQDYLTLHPTERYIVYNDLPKIEALKTIFPTIYRATPVLVGAGR